MTEQEKHVLAFIHRKLTETAIAPSIREIAHERGLSSTSGVVRQLRNLERQGYIVRTKNRVRDIRMTLHGERALGLDPKPKQKFSVFEDRKLAEEIEQRCNSQSPSINQQRLDDILTEFFIRYGLTKAAQAVRETLK